MTNTSDHVAGAVLARAGASSGSCALARRDAPCAERAGCPVTFA
ncbi:hypothetical protein SCE1572_18160 [Sorangium cellulosum So0157-2]|uniref:Uncharacterized protein n=1 Tax=Sorangium cellulosum So0157-2 TaxID=1254432 RepID=S4XWG3_SORCE|nr:hypothetical protein SCE1572_18160 [Sorangium cellulosum So0157-2]